MSLAPPSLRRSQFPAPVASLIGSAGSYLAGYEMATIIASAALAFFALRMACSDYRSRVIYHADLAGFAAIGFAWVLCTSQEPEVDLLRAVIHSCAYAAAFELINKLYRSARGRAGMGPADVKLAATLGPLLGLEAFGFALLAASILGFALLGGRWLILGRRPGRYTYMPYGAVLAVAGYLTWLVSQI